MTGQRVLYVNHEVELGGAETSLIDLIASLDRARYEPVLACSEPGPLAERAAELACETRYLPMLFPKGLRKMLGVARAGRQLRRIALEVGADLLHANTLIAGYVATIARGRGKRWPLIWHVRDLHYPTPARRLLPRASRVVCNSEATAQDLQQGSTWPNLEVVYNGISDAFFANDPAARTTARATVREEFNIPQRDQLVGMVGRLDPQKGHLAFLDAARMVLRRQHDTTFVIAGDVALADGRARFAEYRNDIERYSRDLGIFGKVVFAGRREDVPRLMQAMDVFVHPTEQFESFGRSVAEAHASGLPVVASRLGGLPEIVQDGENGFLFEPGDAEAMASRILCLLDDPNLAAAMAGRGRAAALSRFTSAAHAEGVMSIYASVREGADRARTGR